MGGAPGVPAVIEGIPRLTPWMGHPRTTLQVLWSWCPTL
jgi:hypothetical protein